MPKSLIFLTCAGAGGTYPPSPVGRLEGNWMACNTAHDVVLPHAKGKVLGFFMHLTSEHASGRCDAYAPDGFNYQISACEVTA